jgi:RecA-family ATPase
MSGDDNVLKLRRKVKRKFEESAATLVSVRADQIHARNVNWLWRNRFAIAKIGIIAGDPDQGKSQVIADIAARVTRGAPWPDGSGNAPLGRVIILNAEDTPEDTIKPRLMAANANLQRITVVKATKKEGKESTFSLSEDLQLLERMIDEMRDVKVVVIDPVTSYLGVKKMDSFRATDVRGILEPLIRLAERKQVLILLIHHFNKNSMMTNALHRLSDSGAFGAAPRIVWLCIPDPEDNDTILFLRGRVANARRNLTGLSYTIKEAVVEEDGEKIITSHIEWDEEPVNITANEALAQGRAGRPSDKVDAATQWLKDYLSRREGRCAPAKVVKEQGEVYMHRPRTLERAASRLGIVVTRLESGKGKGQPTLWTLPQDDDE